MIDTIKLCSPVLDGLQARAIHTRLQQHLVRDNTTAEYIKETTWALLPGPYGVLLRCTLLPHSDAPAPFLVIEGSAHKLLLGHNVSGGPICFQATGRWLVDCAARLLGSPLPPGDEWTVERADWAEAYHLSSQAIEDLFIGLNTARFPRRERCRYKATGITFVGATTTITLYAKGPEFGRKDARRLGSYFPTDTVTALRTCAATTLRGEVSVKARKLAADFRAKPTVGTVSAEYLRAVYDREFGRMLLDARGALTTVRTEMAVDDRLTHLYRASQGQRLYGIWCQLARFGEEAVRRKMPRQTFSRHRKRLLDAGCCWLATDVHGLTASLPEDFRLTSDGPYRDVDVSPSVREQLAIFDPFHAAPCVNVPYAVPDAASQTSLPHRVFLPPRSSSDSTL